MRTEESELEGSLLSCAEEVGVPAWQHEVRNELADVLRVSEEQASVRGVFGLSWSANSLRRVYENNLNSSVENRGASVKAARQYQIYAFAALQFEVRLEISRQSCHRRLRRETRPALALPNNSLRERHRGEFGVGAGIEVVWALLCCSRQSKKAGCVTTLQISVRSEPCRNAS